jgi:hypothetical protein
MFVLLVNEKMMVLRVRGAEKSSGAIASIIRSIQLNCPVYFPVPIKS